MAEEEFGMVVVDGVRYRPEDAPKTAEKPPAKKAAPAKTKVREPQPAAAPAAAAEVDTK